MNKIDSDISMNKMIKSKLIMFGYPESSKWVCYMFGGTEFSGIHWRPNKGEVPNFFYRFMSRVFFGCRWVKDT